MTVTTWVLTGASGFVGRHVLNRLRSEKSSSTDRVICLGRRRPEGCAASDFWAVDLEQGGEWTVRLRALRPRYVIHAAGRTPPATSERLYRANVAATRNVLASVRDTNARVVVVGSAAELGPVPARLLPADELCPCRPIDAYGLSKWAAARLGLHYWERWALDVVVARLFNPIGPGQPAIQVFGRFTRMLESLDPCADHGSLDVGDTSARRDFVDVRDAAQALIGLARQGRAGRIYHVGTGRSRSVGEGFTRLLAESGRRLALREGESPVPPALADSRASIERITSETDWCPRIAFEQSLRDLWASHERQARRIA